MKKDIILSLIDYNSFKLNYDELIKDYINNEKIQHNYEIETIQTIKGSNLIFFIVEVMARDYDFAIKKAAEEVHINIGIYNFLI